MTALCIDLASHLRPDHPVEVIGLRPGEKQHEVLLSIHRAAPARFWGWSGPSGFCAMTLPRGKRWCSLRLAHQHRVRQCHAVDLGVTALLQGKSMRHTIVKRLQTNLRWWRCSLSHGTRCLCCGVKILRQGLKDSASAGLLLLPLFGHRSVNELAVRIASGTALAGAASVLASLVVLPGVEVFDGRWFRFNTP